MNIFDKLTGKAKREEELRLAAVAEAEKIAKKELAAKKRAEAKAKKAEDTKKSTASNPNKDAATAAGEPWVDVISVDINPEDPSQGAFELDWNEIFVARLVKAGFQGKTDQVIVDNWFRSVCQNVVMEVYEQEQADPEKRSNRRDLGNGRTEIS